MVFSILELKAIIRAASGMFEIKDDTTAPAIITVKRRLLVDLAKWVIRNFRNLFESGTETNAKDNANEAIVKYGTELVNPANAPAIAGALPIGASRMETRGIAAISIRQTTGRGTGLPMSRIKKNTVSPTMFFPCADSPDGEGSKTIAIKINTANAITSSFFKFMISFNSLTAHPFLVSF
jgi:hypothetical protein